MCGLIVSKSLKKANMQFKMEDSNRNNSKGTINEQRKVVNGEK